MAGRGGGKGPCTSADVNNCSCQQLLHVVLSELLETHQESHVEEHKSCSVQHYGAIVAMQWHQREGSRVCFEVLGEELANEFG
jgi:hypothetical protein